MKPHPNHFADQLAERGIECEHIGKCVFRVQARRDNRAVVMYYPLADKWQHRGRMYGGDFHAFTAFMEAL